MKEAPEPLRRRGRHECLEGAREADRALTAAQRMLAEALAVTNWPTSAAGGCYPPSHNRLQRCASNLWTVLTRAIFLLRASLGDG